jgi:hypothetical protein
MDFEAVIKATLTNAEAVETKINELIKDRTINITPTISNGGTTGSSVSGQVKRQIDQQVGAVQKYTAKKVKQISYSSGNVSVNSDLVKNEIKRLKKEQSVKNDIEKSYSLSTKDTSTVFTRATSKQAKNLKEQQKVLDQANKIAKSFQSDAQNTQYVKATDKLKKIQDDGSSHYRSTKEAYSSYSTKRIEASKAYSKYSENSSLANAQSLIKANNELEQSYTTLSNHLEVATAKQKEYDSVTSKQTKQAETRQKQEQSYDQWWQKALKTREDNTLDQANKIASKVDNDVYSSKTNKNLQTYTSFANKDTEEFNNATVAIRAESEALQDVIAKRKQYAEVQSIENATALNTAHQTYKSANEYTNSAFSSVKTNGGVAIGTKQLQSFSVQVEKYIEKNPRVYKQYQSQFEDLRSAIQTGNVAAREYQEMQGNFTTIKSGAVSQGLEGNSIFGELKRGAKQIGQFVLTYGALQKGVEKFSESISEIKEIDTILTEISKTSDSTQSELEALGKSSYSTASKYGRTASDYLTGVQEMNRSGYYGEKGNQMAELSVLAQSAGDLDADTANKYILATNAAYKYAGSVEKLNAVLDGQNAIKCGRAA